MGHKGQASRNLLTGAGDIHLDRLYLGGPRCGASRYPLARRLGVCGYVTCQARKFLSLAGAIWSFAGAAGHVLELRGLRTGDQTIGKVGFEAAGLLADWLPTGPAAGEDFREATRWGLRPALLRDGGEGLQRQVRAKRAEVGSAAKGKALDELAGDFGKQKEHRNYAARLQAGQAIGSGLVEGASKQVVGRRLKQTGARWRVRRANRMATLSCTLQGNTRGPYWDHPLS